MLPRTPVLRGLAAAACLVGFPLGAQARPPAASAAKSPTARAATSPAARTADPARRRTVIIDAGHGGVDPGMRGTTSARRTIYEKDIVLQVSRRLEAQLAAAGVNVVMTRTSDTLIARADRGRIANKAEGDLFISVHVNAANPNWKNATAARGFETYFLSEAKTEDERRVAAMENESVRFETDAEIPDDDVLGFLFNDLAQNEHLRESRDLAEAIQRGMRGAHPGPSRGVKQAGFQVLVTAFMPAVLVEIGFGTNRSEADWMASAAGQERLAAAIAQGALTYLARYERRVSGGTSGGGK